MGRTKQSTVSREAGESAWDDHVSASMAGEPANHEPAWAVGQPAWAVTALSWTARELSWTVHELS
jgi:hypothetical protein